LMCEVRLPSANFFKHLVARNGAEAVPYVTVFN